MLKLIKLIPTSGLREPDYLKPEKTLEGLALEVRVPEHDLEAVDPLLLALAGKPVEDRPEVVLVVLHGVNGADDRLRLDVIKPAVKLYQLVQGRLGRDAAYLAFEPKHRAPVMAETWSGRYFVGLAGLTKRILDQDHRGEYRGVDE